MKSFAKTFLSASLGVSLGVSLAGSLLVSLVVNAAPTFAQGMQPGAYPPDAQQGAPGNGMVQGSAPVVNAATDNDFQQRLQQIDQMVATSLAEQNVPGYCIAIIKDGKVVFQKPYGFADAEARIPVTPDTVFGLASLTKTFTALTLLACVDKGLVKLDDPLSKYIDGLTPEYQPLTIRQLASMTAGVPKVLSQEVLWKDQLDILDHTPLVSQPGSEFLYSNFSYRLLGSVISKVTGRNYLEMVREVIFEPFGMNSSATTVMLQPTGRVAQAYGDNMGAGPVRRVEYKNPAISFSAGMLASTNNDLCNYVFGMWSRKTLSEQGYKTLWYERPPLTTGKPSKWAFGWSSNRRANMNNQLVVAMNGGTPGVASSIIMMPEAQCAVVTLSNLRKPPVYQIAKNAFNMAFGNGQPADEPEHTAGSDSD